MAILCRVYRVQIRFLQTTRFYLQCRRRDHIANKRIPRSHVSGKGCSARKFSDHTSWYSMQSRRSVLLSVFPMSTPGRIAGAMEDVRNSASAYFALSTCQISNFVVAGLITYVFPKERGGRLIRLYSTSRYSLLRRVSLMRKFDEAARLVPCWRIFQSDRVESSYPWTSYRRNCNPSLPWFKLLQLRFALVHWGKVTWVSLSICVLHSHPYRNCTREEEWIIAINMELLYNIRTIELDEMTFRFLY